MAQISELKANILEHEAKRDERDIVVERVQESICEKASLTEAKQEIARLTELLEACEKEKQGLKTSLDESINCNAVADQVNVKLDE